MAERLLPQQEALSRVISRSMEWCYRRTTRPKDYPDEEVEFAKETLAINLECLKYIAKLTDNPETLDRLDYIGLGIYHHPNTDSFYIQDDPDLS